MGLPGTRGHASVGDLITSKPDFRSAVLREMQAQAMNQSDLARLSGVTRPKISAWLAGRSGMSEANLWAITRALRMELRGTA